MRFFYQGIHQHTCIDGSITRAVLRHGEQLLALQQTGLLPRTSLIPTDVANSVSEHESRSIAYSPYGHAELPSLNFGFKGERRDTVTGHYHLGNGYRAYNPVLMRFHSPDRDSPFDRGGLNPYVFVMNDPVNLRDPSGHGPIGPGKIAFTYEGWAARVKDLAVFWTSDLSSPTGLALNIYGHGTVGKIQISPGKLMSGTAMLDMVGTELGIDVSGHSVHMISCHSATRPIGGGLSMIEQVMSRTQSSVTGYQGPVHVRENYTPEQYAIEIVESNTFEPGSRNHEVFRYNPVKIAPGDTGVLNSPSANNSSIRSSIRGT